METLAEKQNWARAIQREEPRHQRQLREGEDTGERLQGAAVVPGQEPLQLRHGGGGRGGGQHPAVKNLQVSQREIQ